MCGVYAISRGHTSDPVRGRHRHLCHGPIRSAGGIRSRGLLLASNGFVGAAIAVLVAGSLVLFVADHFVRPLIIGEGAKLPFLWVLLGILGGIESFGLVGIFLGPALMAALVSVWRSWVADTAHHPEARPRIRAAPELSVGGLSLRRRDSRRSPSGHPPCASAGC